MLAKIAYSHDMCANNKIGHTVHFSFFVVNYVKIELNPFTVFILYILISRKLAMCRLTFIH